MIFYFSQKRRSINAESDCAGESNDANKNDDTDANKDDDVCVGNNNADGRGVCADEGVYAADNDDDSVRRK
ncbi:ribosome biogenesis protein bop1-like protein [Lasius niger]|uniref:Ribosome biogenesis protein bop1-like protein n=1 Tax=Lasius niger TaxID=67767 RepID=A0A0J7MQQ6_LASNI|nr:ribosome biogenesis protein bop1-like protein [Lasius niger]